MDHRESGQENGRAEGRFGFAGAVGSYERQVSLRK